MSSLLSFADGRAFATGAIPYFIGPVGSVAASRLLIRVAIEGQIVVAVVDTGAPYFVCEPALAAMLAPRLTDPLEAARLKIRGIEYRGMLYLLSVTFEASQGEDLRTLATIFIPQLDPWQMWELPSFVGLTGMLDRLRFAVDPDASLFYFGPLGGTI